MKRVTFNLELNKQHLVPPQDDSRDGKIWLDAAEKRLAKKQKRRRQEGTREVTVEGTSVFVPRNGLFL